MIITCPNSGSEYDILETALGEEGREVKCAKCTHKWFATRDGQLSNDDEALLEDTSETVDDRFLEQAQDGGEEAVSEASETIEEKSEEKYEDVSEEISEEISEEEIDIPEGVKPIQEDEEQLPKPPTPLAAKMAGYGAALMIFGLLISYIFVNKNEIIGMWLPSALFYEMAGVPAELKGEGLIVETLSATVLKNSEQKDVLVIKGRVVNLTSAPVDVPKMQANMRTTNGDEAESWIIDPPVETIEPGESFSFTSDYPNVDQAVASVNLAFIATIKN